jgi:ferrous iron transport protein A
MGVTSGADVKLVRVAPLGDPIEVTIRGYQLSLRKAEAEIVIMEEDKK